MLYQVLIIAYLIVALCLIGLVLIQQGKGADMGASFGAGGSNTVFGSSGSGNFLTRATTWLAIAFFVISLVLGNITANTVKATDEWNNLEVSGEVSSSVAVSDVPAKTSNSDVPASETSSSQSDVPE